jgi:hypothetical protein
MRTDVTETVKSPAVGEEKAVKLQHAQNILPPYNSLRGVLLDRRDMGLSIVQVKYPGAFSCFSCVFPAADPLLSVNCKGCRPIVHSMALSEVVNRGCTEGYVEYFDESVAKKQ